MAFHRGPKVVTNGLVLALDAANHRSYPGSGTNWSDLSKNKYTSTLVNGPTYTKNNAGLIVLDGVNDWVSIPGSTTVYSSDFTWQSFHYIRSYSNTLQGMWWSEGNTKNFLMAYANSNVGSTYMRIDTPSTVYQSPDVGTRTNGFVDTAGPITNRWLFTTIVKSGSTFRLYWDNSVLMWTITISDWSIPDTAEAIAFGARNDSNFATAMNIANIMFYNRALTVEEITQNYNAIKLRFNI